MQSNDKRISARKYAWSVKAILARKRTYKNADETAHTFSGKSKNVTKRTKNGHCVNPP